MLDQQPTARKNQNGMMGCIREPIFNPKQKAMNIDKIQINPGEVLEEIEKSVEDSTVLEEIKSNYDFSDESHFKESYAENMGMLDGIKSATIVKAQLGPKGLSPKSKLISETILENHNRPALIVRNGSIEPARNSYWRDILEKHQRNILDVMPSIGRIDLVNHPRNEYAGTGFLLEGGQYILTNRHVAERFILSHNQQWHFTQFRGRKVRAYLDFKEEYYIPEEAEFKLKCPVYVAPTNAPDVAIFEISKQNEDGLSLPKGLSLSSKEYTAGTRVGTIGYPSRFGFEGDFAIVEAIFQRIYRVKRFAPGELLENCEIEHEYFHDCSTLAGNSGSPVINLETGEVIGLHHAGESTERNWAVKSTYLLKLMAELGL